MFTFRNLPFLKILCISIYQKNICSQMCIALGKSTNMDSRYYLSALPDSKDFAKQRYYRNTPAYSVNFCRWKPKKSPGAAMLRPLRSRGVIWSFPNL